MIMQQTAQTQGWHVANWGFWGWLETAVKFIGIVAGWIAFAGALSAPGFMFRSNPRLAAVIVLALLTLPTLAVPFVRIGQREVISVIYALFNLTGHLAMLFALLRTPEQRGLAILFGVCYVIGELVKQRFLSLTGYTEGGANPGMMLNVSRGLMAFYILFVILQIL